MGGLVFLALSRPYLQHKFGHNQWVKKTPSTLKYVYYNRLREFKDQQCIVLSQVLASDITVGYHNYKHYILETINDNDGKIKNLKHLTSIVDGLCKNKNKNKFIKFKFEGEHIIVLDMNKALNSTNDILKRHKIEHDRSENLRILNDGGVDVKAIKNEDDNEIKQNVDDNDNKDKIDNIKQIQIIQS